MEKIIKEIILPLKMDVKQMRAVVLIPEVIDQINQLVEYAHLHPFSMDDLLDIYNGQMNPPGDNPNFVVNIPVGIRAVFTIEEQNPGKVRHLSISVDTPCKLPSPDIISVLLPLFGFKNSIDDCYVRVETISEELSAITIIELI